MNYNTLFKENKPIIGVIHLPRIKEGNEELVIKTASEEAIIYSENKLDGIIIENFNNKPYLKDRIPNYEKKVLTSVINEVSSITTLPIGLNVLRNDILTALEIASNTSISFIRVNFLIGVSLAPEGLIEGAAKYLRNFEDITSNILIFADIFTKHSLTLYPRSIYSCVHEVIDRGCADVIVVTGKLTGLPPSIKLLGKVKRITEVPVFVGSGLNPNNLILYLLIADGAIVSSYFREGHRAGKKLVTSYVSEFMKKVLEVRKLLST